MRSVGYDVHPGDLGENLTKTGLKLERLPLGLVKLGTTAVVELTGLHTPCILIDRFRPGLRARMIRTKRPGGLALKDMNRFIPIKLRA